MGYPKALLPIGPEPMLLRVLRILRSVVSPVVVVAAANQELPELPEAVRLTRDQRPSRGPLEGLAAGLASLRQDGNEATVAYLTSCDVPLLRPELVRRMIELSQGYDVAVPRVGEFLHPLAGVYRLAVESHARALLQEDRLRPVFLFDRVRTRIVDMKELQDVDSAGDSFFNLNYPQQYLDVLDQLGYEVPLEVQQKLATES